MAAALQREGRAEHEEAAVEHEGHVVGPLRRRVEDVARHHLVAQRQHHRHDQPGGEPPRPDGNAVEAARQQRQRGISGVSLGVG